MSHTTSSPARSVDVDVLRLSGTLILIVRLLDQSLRRSDANELSIPDLSVLGQVSHGNELPSTIARALRLDPARVTRITDRLVGLGYLGRAEDERDRRRCVLRLTISGADRLIAAKSQLSTAMTDLLVGIQESDRRSVMDVLEKVRRQIDTR